MYAKPRSVNNDLHIGMTEGSHNSPCKDWGGPHEPRSREPHPDTGHDPELVDSPGVNL